MKYCVKCMKNLLDDSNICNACGAEQNIKIPIHHLPIGTVLNNRYYVCSCIDENDFELTYLGKDILIDENVIIKEYFPNKFVGRRSDKSLNVFNIECKGSHNYELSRDTFVKEATALQNMNGLESLINIEDIFTENNTAYYVRDYVYGTTLESYIELNGCIEEDFIVKHMLPIINSLSKMNRQGIIHCNISPHTIMLLEDDSVRLFDFGLAVHSLVASDNPLFLEKPSGYIALETYARKPNLVPATDVYSLCATLYKSITGVTPPSVLDRHIKDEIKSPYALGIMVSPNVEYAIMKGLSLHQIGRYESMSELYNALSCVNADEENIDKTEHDISDLSSDLSSENKKSKPNIRVKFTL